ncbi:hypothetical protein [Pseudomonas citronellolis]|uniref:hypothetical protein n=1 Tax=Pseudomonas citronellolis TaxID=53408 RepID=UPI0022BA4714|nr:hypothetical protein [Pseudomonas citronellolis]WBG64648.1 hypothetical protein ELR50_17820 [Pseudomonas citronellolis]
MAFCGGALVFPGGKVEQADGHVQLRQHCLGADALDDDELRFRVAGLRELFEESGILLAQRADSVCSLGWRKLAASAICVFPRMQATPRRSFR